MTTVSQPLQSEALAFLDAIEQDKANAESRAAEMEQANFDLTRQLANANDTIAKHEATIAQQQATIAQMEAASQQPAVEPKPEPSNPEPSNPEPEPTSDAYSRDKVIAGLIAIKGNKSHVFGIVDVCGNVYADEAEWILDGKPQVLGIGYTDGKHHLCMHPKKVGAAAFGGNGVMFGRKVHTTKRQWAKDTTATENAAWDDYSGVSNTEGIKEGCSGSLAARCFDYMPACAELRIYCKYFPVVDVLLKAVGGDKLKVQNGAYLLWSSTCRDANNAWCIRFMNEGDAQPAYRAKTSSLFTRQFIRL